MNLFLVTGFPTIATPLWSIANPANSNGLAQKMVPEMIWTTPEMEITTTTMSLSTPWKS